ncbi:hypothetical protein Q9233_008635 [Columba guinea]|nr:hypothetical protein Q9233_008635 [Columba guinea]
MSSCDLPWLLSPGSSPGLSILTASAQQLLCLSGRGQQDFYGVYSGTDVYMEITENSKKWKPLLVEEEKLSIIRVNSSYLRSMNDYRVTFLYRTFKFRY